jgi:hypothetical protein
LELPLDFEWKLEVGDNLSVCLDPGTDMREDNWSASVIRPFPYAHLDGVTMILRRRYIEEEGRYDDADPPVIWKLGNRKGAKHQPRKLAKRVPRFTCELCGISVTVNWVWCSNRRRDAGEDA